MVLFWGGLMINIDLDVLNTIKLFRYERSNIYQEIFFASNENLKKLFSYIDINDKDVLSVLGSGDQAFFFLDKGAKSVDIFDKNKLAIYYFYLRKWIIEKLNLYYPPIPMENSFIKSVINLVDPRDDREKLVVEYWKKICLYYGTWDFFELFLCFEDCYCQNEVTDICNLKKRLKSFSFDYYDIDITKDIDIDKKYDIIYTSNISEWIYMNNGDYEKYINNLYKTLKDDGLIISSHLYNSQLTSKEEEKFSELFKLVELPKFITSDNNLKSLGYVMVKK